MSGEKSPQIRNSLLVINRIALCLFFFSLNYEVWDPLHTGGLFSVSRAMGYLYLFTLMPQINKFIRTDRIGKAIFPVWLLIFLITIMSLIYATPTNNRFIDISLIQNGFLFWFLINHERREPFVLERGLLWFAFGTISLALFYWGGIGITVDADGRATIFNDNENVVAIRMTISIAILLFSAIYNRMRLKKSTILVMLLPLPIMLSFLFQTGSRVAFISFALSMLMGILLFKTKNIRLKVASLFIGAGIVAYSWIVLSKSETFIRRMVDTLSFGNLGGREEIWRNLIPLIQSHFLFGVGETGYSEYSLQTFGMFTSPHNVVFEILSYSGIVGLAIFIIFMLRIFARAIQLYKKENNLLPLLLFVPIIGLLASGQMLHQKIVWCIFAYVVGVSAFRRRMIKLRTYPVAGDIGAE